MALIAFDGKSSYLSHQVSFLCCINSWTNNKTRYAAQHKENLGQGFILKNNLQGFTLDYHRILIQINHFISCGFIILASYRCRWKLKVFILLNTSFLSFSDCIIRCFLASILPCFGNFIQLSICLLVIIKVLSSRFETTFQRGLNLSFSITCDK